MQKYLIYSPHLDQSFVIAYFLHKYLPKVKIIGVRMKGERGRINQKYFLEIRSIQKKLLNNNNYIHIPTGATSTKYLLENKGDIRIGQITLTRQALRVFDKVWLLNFAESIGIPIPKTWDSLEKVEKYPIFCKNRIETGRGVRTIVKSFEEVKLKGYNKKKYIYQELINSKGTYGVSFLAKNGKIIAWHMHFERESFPPEGGSAVIIEKFYDSKLLKYTRRLIRALNYSGWGLVEFKYCPKRNDYVLMEINSKFWASCEFTFINEPKFLELLFGINLHEKPVERMIFANRVFLRGWRFILENTNFLKKGVWRFYPGWAKALLIGSIPSII